MNTTRKLALGLGVASGALLAAWLLTGERKQKTRHYIVRKAGGLKSALQSEKSPFDDSGVYYI